MRTPKNKKKNSNSSMKSSTSASPPTSPTTEQAPRSKIAERLTKAVERAPPTKNRSPELIPLAADYEVMKRSLRNLVVAVKKYSEQTDQLHQARGELVQQMAILSEKTPLYQHVGHELDGDAIEALTNIHNPTTTTTTTTTTTNTTPNESSSLTVADIASEWNQRSGMSSNSLAILQTLASTQSQVNAREFRQHILNYTIEWEQIVTARVDAELKHVKKLEADRRHYERKVEQLRQKCNELEAKGKSSPASQADKLQRNEIKLKDSYILHEQEAGRLCVLMETVTRDGWLDLYPLVKNYMKWESNRVGRESDVYCQLAATLEDIKGTYKHRPANLK